MEPTSRAVKTAEKALGEGNGDGVVQAGETVAVAVLDGEAYRAVERLKQALVQAEISHGTIERNEPRSVEAAEGIQITIRGVPPGRAAELRRVTSDALGRAWIPLPEHGTGLRRGIAGEHALTLRQDTVTQCVNTIQRRIDSLGTLASAS